MRPINLTLQSIVLASIGAVFFLTVSSSVAAPDTQNALERNGRVVGKEKQVGRPMQSKNRLRMLRESVDAGQHYVLEDGRKVSLLRTADEICVRYAEGQTPEEGIAKLQAKGGIPALNRVSTIRSGAGRVVEILAPAVKGSAFSAKAVATSANVEWAYPVLFDPTSMCRMVPTDEILVQLAEGTSVAELHAVFTAARVVSVRQVAARTLNIYALRLLRPKEDDPLAVSQALGVLPKILWANPNFLRELDRQYTPNDTHFSKQQDKHNTGQNGGTSDADVDAPEAWNMTTGTASVVIAIIDDGVDTGHGDLSIRVNPGESGGGKETNGLDDDGNGYIDDWRGWDFFNGDNDPSPTGTDGHGTACAGVAAATINNASMMAGIAGGCSILPVKISDGDSFAADSDIGDAISYAADRADVISCSWGGGSSAAVINTALRYAFTNGRAGKGSPVFCASGNYASRWNYGGSRIRVALTGYSGTYYLGFCFYRGSTASGENTVAIDDVCLLDSDGYTHKTGALPSQNFESSTFPPTGWSHLSDIGTAAWTRSTTNVKKGSGGSYSVRAPSLSSGTYTADLLTPALTLTGAETFTFDYYESAGANSGFFVDIYNSSKVYIDSIAGFYTAYPTISTSTIVYPSSETNTIAVGASTDCNQRSDYSQYSSALDFTAPSNGGWNDVPSLDPSGSIGWSSGASTMEFGGTSSATPLSAGIGALMLSANPRLTAAQVRTLMRKSCDKIGGVTYSGGDAGAGGVNLYYGYGKINAFLAVSNAIAATTCVVTFNPQGGTVVPTTATVTNGLIYGTLPVPIRAGYSAAGWWTGLNGTGSEVTAATAVTVITNHTLSAKWTPNQYTATFSAQGGTTPSPATKSVTFASTYGTLATTSREGYAFSGWYTNSSYTGSEVTSGTAVTIPANHSLYAKWTPNVYTVTFVAQGGTTPSPATKSVTFASTYGTLATTSREGYAFSGWYTNSSYTGSEVTSGTAVTIPANHSLYAKWNEIVTSHGTPATWLIQYGLVSGDNYEPADIADTDGDGHAAWQEYVAGTVPTNKASVLLATLLEAGGQPQLHWKPDLTGAVPARVYSVFGTASLLYGFQPAPLTNIPAGTPIPVQALSTNRFFKIGVGLQP